MSIATPFEVAEKHLATRFASPEVLDRALAAGGLDAEDIRALLKAAIEADRAQRPTLDRTALIATLDEHHHDYDSDCGWDSGCSCGAIEDYNQSDIGHAEHLADVVLSFTNDRKDPNA